MRTPETKSKRHRRPSSHRKALGWFVALVVSGGAVSGFISDTAPARAEARPGAALSKLTKPVAKDVPHSIRQLWVWHFGTPADLIKLAQTTKVTQLLVWVSPGFTKIPSMVDRLQRLINLAAPKNISVVALGGDPAWASTPAAAGSWVHEVALSGLFTRIHLDIEPNALKDWALNQDALSRGLLSALDAANANGAGLLVSADIPSWFNTVTVGTSRLDTEVINRVSDVTIMAYRDNVAAVLKAARPEVAEAGRLQKSAYIGINIGSAGVDGPTTTMLGQPGQLIFKQMQQIEASASQWNGYVGLAIEDSVYLSMLV